MEKDKFKNLEIGEYFHDFGRGYEFKKVESNSVYCDCECTYKIPFDISTVGVGEKSSIDYDSSCIENFTLGRHPDNIKPEPEQELFVNVYDDSDVGIRCYSAYKTKEEAYEKRTGVQKYLYTAKLIPVEIQQPFVPKHDEVCRFINQNGVTLQCRAIHTDGKICALSLDKEKGYYDWFHEPNYIKQFLPL